MREAAQPARRGQFERLRRAVAMAEQRSRIPVFFRLRRPEPPAEVQLTSYAKRKCVSSSPEPGCSGAPSFDIASNIPADGVLKDANQRLPKSNKKVELASKKRATRCHPTRYHLQQLEAELKNKDQLVETLKQKLAKAEELKKENERLVQELDRIKKAHPRSLESVTVHPVSTSLKEDDTQELQEQPMMISAKVTEELMLFFHSVAEMKEMLKTVMTDWKLAQDKKLHALEKHSYIQAQVKECAAMLEALQRLLEK